VPPKTVAARIEARIHVVRGERVMLDVDLAALYGVQTGRLNEAVRRNRARFPSDFMFRLTVNETEGLLSQIAIANRPRRGGSRDLPFAFTEQGMAMLSSVLHNDRAVAVNILIMRTFVQLRRSLTQTTELGHRVDEIERQIDIHGAVLVDVLQALRALERSTPLKRREIGFRSKT
jgi:ORF6N domain